MWRSRTFAGVAAAMICLGGAGAATADDAARPLPAPAAAEADALSDQSLDADTASRPPTRPDDLTPDLPQPTPAGRLIPPDTPATETEPETIPAPEPTGPPAYAELRESDFDFAACRLELTTLGTVYEELPAIVETEDRDCGIARPLHIDQILPGIAVQGGAQMRCDTARALAHWMRDFVLPAARFLPGAPRVNAIAPGTTYQCRGVVGGASTSRLSEHALGNAIDIAGFGFADAPPVEIAPRDDSGGDMTIAFQRAVRASACLYFTTVLGPGSNAAHDDHLHLDVKQRRGGYRLCQ